MKEWIRELKWIIIIIYKYLNVKHLFIYYIYFFSKFCPPEYVGLLPRVLNRNASFVVGQQMQGSLDGLCGSWNERNKVNWKKKMKLKKKNKPKSMVLYSLFPLRWNSISDSVHVRGSPFKNSSSSFLYLRSFKQFLFKTAVTLHPFEISFLFRIWNKMPRWPCLQTCVWSAAAAAGVQHSEQTNAKITKDPTKHGTNNLLIYVNSL